MEKEHFKPVARLGYFSRGIVYLIIGAFAFLAAYDGRQAQGTEGALQSLLTQPFGEFLVMAMIAGLVAYVLWRLTQALLDADDHGHSPKGLAIRISLLASAFTYATLAVYAASLLGLFGFLSGSGGEGSGHGVADAIAGVVGRQGFAFVLAGIFTIVGGAHWWKAFTGKFADRFDAGDRLMMVLGPISVAGLFARGVVFFILAFLLTWRGASAGDGGDTPGIADALEFLQTLPFGPWLLMAMGAGIVLFAAYSFCEAFWRRVDVAEAFD